MSFFIGFIIGGIFGFVITAVLNASSDAEDSENACYRTPRMVVERESSEPKIINYCCPTCNNIVNARLKERSKPAFEKTLYCEKCGQAIDWSDTK